eukprot:TRINITY_DN9387_c1_g1_i7.p1 TRINITY_DN9387_c1_g1~~TRINITY_DN9387_c1_g1_i7.p1  ORF type:complete len:288 (-),score=27.91 TRINITY_DN9387_c1_g1_i7:186-1049(-)
MSAIFRRYTYLYSKTNFHSLWQCELCQNQKLVSQVCYLSLFQNQNYFGGKELFQLQWQRFANVKQSENLEIPRMNDQIQASEVRVKLSDSESKVMQISDALLLAKEKDMDLIQTVPHANPPVCIIMQYNKFKFEKRKKEREMKKKTMEKTLKEKEISFTFLIDPHDLGIKLKKIKELLESGYKVRTVIKTGRNVKIDPLIELVGKLFESFEENCTFHYGSKEFLNQPVDIFIVNSQRLKESNSSWMKAWTRKEIEDQLWKLEKKRQMEDQGFLSAGNPETTPSEKVK